MLRRRCTVLASATRTRCSSARDRLLASHDSVLALRSRSELSRLNAEPRESGRSAVMARSRRRRSPRPRRPAGSSRRRCRTRSRRPAIARTGARGTPRCRWRCARAAAVSPRTAPGRALASARRRPRAGTSRAAGVKLDARRDRQGPVRGRPRGVAPSRELRARLRGRPRRRRERDPGGGRRRRRTARVRARRRRRRDVRDRQQLAAARHAAGAPPARRGGRGAHGVVQATALAPTALQARRSAKASALSGPRRAAGSGTAACSCSTTARTLR